MKTVKAFAAALLTLGCTIPATQAATWTNFLRQIQAVSGAVLQVDVAATGSRLSLLPMEEGGATFELWTVSSEAGSTPILLNSTFVGTYQIGATITINSLDPYAVIPRTRVDKPFSVAVNVSGLTSASGAETAATQVLFKHDIMTYPTGTYQPANGQTATSFYSGYITQNGASTFTFTPSNLSSPFPATASGEEQFNVYSLAGYQVAQQTLASARVQVWPIARATISGITAGATYLELPETTFTLSELYPDSTTWVQIYPGSPALGTVGTTVPESTIVIKDVTPQTRTLILRDWSAVPTSDGAWTLEVLHKTPFGTERLAYTTFVADVNVEVNGQIISSE